MNNLKIIFIFASIVFICSTIIFLVVWLTDDDDKLDIKDITPTLYINIPITDYNEIIGSNVDEINEIEHQLMEVERDIELMEAELP